MIYLLTCYTNINAEMKPPQFIVYIFTLIFALKSLIHLGDLMHHIHAATSILRICHKIQSCRAKNMIFYQKIKNQGFLLKNLQFFCLVFFFQSKAITQE